MNFVNIFFLLRFLWRIIIHFLDLPVPLHAREYTVKGGRQLSCWSLQRRPGVSPLRRHQALAEVLVEVKVLVVRLCGGKLRLRRFFLRHRRWRSATRVLPLQFLTILFKEINQNSLKIQHNTIPTKRLEGGKLLIKGDTSKKSTYQKS